MQGQFGGLEPILCAHLFRKVDNQLIELLGSLTPDEWDLQTVAPAWKVRDVAAHLLDTALRKLSMGRDKWVVDPVVIRSAQDVVELVNRLNREGVTVYRRMSPPVMIELMSIACEEYASHHESIDPFTPARIGVSWAGEDSSLNWFDTARELTERWHHQQQIRLATNRPGGMTPDVYYPVLDCFLRALPFHYRDVDHPTGTTLSVKIVGDCGGTWILRREESGWRFLDNLPPGVTASVSIPQEIAWRIFTKGCERGWAAARIRVEGDCDLGEKILNLIAIVA